MKEKRIEQRFDVCLTARWQGSAANYYVRITDISSGGCYVDTIAEARTGETLMLQILLRDDEWFEVQGVVAHVSPRLGFGVRFINLDHYQIEVIRLLLSKENQSTQKLPAPKSDSTGSDGENSLPRSDQPNLTSSRIM